MKKINLAFGLKFEDLYSYEGLVKLDSIFIKWLSEINTELHNELVTFRLDQSCLENKQESEFLLKLAPFVDDFISVVFSIEKEVASLANSHNELSSIYSCKRLFVQRNVSKKYDIEKCKNFDIKDLQKKLEELFSADIEEKVYADNINQWLEDKELNKDKLEIAAQYAACCLYTAEGKKLSKSGVLFKVPKKLDFENLVPIETIKVDGVTVRKVPDEDIHYRDGFHLTDKGASLKAALDDANYCIYCHNQGKDSCSKGLKDKEGGYRKTVHNVSLLGCPLEEKISEMNLLKAQGVSIGSLAVVVIDNPMCAGTGHRICNDCMKACVYQKQDPVNIPRTETRVLQDILDLPWGFEIYSLLTRWNPLNIKRPLPKPDSGYKILVVGLGPAGFTLSHHLLNEGHVIVAIDGLKIEPLDEKISGTSYVSDDIKFSPIYKVEDIFEDLDKRVSGGFGGVAEYGITVRWNKNYLKIIRLLLERRSNFSMYGGIRFGGTITYEDAFNHYGFDHVALAMGAGKPNVIGIKNILARGVRTASDFLMSLQLTGASRKNSLANLQLRLPVLVIGGGLTAVDTATESLAYYPIQVEKFLTRYESLVEQEGEDKVRLSWTEEEAMISDVFLEHARILRNEKQLAKKENRLPDLIGFLKKWGGAKLVYRRRFVDSPAYRLNHEEVEHAMREGIEFIENASPLEVKMDKYGHVSGLLTSIKEIKEEEKYSEHLLSAKSIFIAAGTNPNTVIAKEDPKHFSLDGKYFQSINEDGNNVQPEIGVSKPVDANVLIYKSEDNKYMSFFGDLHPSFSGNVVKAMGSAKRGYPTISKVLKKALPSSSYSTNEFLKNIESHLSSYVHKVERLTYNIVEVVLYSPAASRNFSPGQFYRLQSYENTALNSNDTLLATEGLALTGAWVDKEKGLVSVIVLEMGGSSNLCQFLKKGERVILMGPTGAPTEIESGKTFMLVGGGLGNAVLFSIGKALRSVGSKVLYFAGYKKSEDRYRIKDIEEASDKIIWACDQAIFTPERDQDRAFHGNIVQAIESYGKGLLGEEDIKLKDVDVIIAIGSDRMMAAIKEARYTVLKEMLKDNHKAIGSINSPMQCMMKEICAQCLQKHIDPKTGEISYVYSCFNQDQNLDNVCFNSLRERLGQNSTQEKLTSQWIKYCFES